MQIHNNHGGGIFSTSKISVSDQVNVPPGFFYNIRIINVKQNNPYSSCYPPLHCHPQGYMAQEIKAFVRPSY